MTAADHELDDIAAQRAAIAAQREALDQERAALYAVDEPDLKEVNLSEEDWQKARYRYRVASGGNSADLLSEEEARSWLDLSNEEFELKWGIDRPTEATPVAAIAEAISSTNGEALEKPWPHQTIEYLGRTLEVRKPSQSAFTALSLLAGIDNLEDTFQVRTLGTFYAKHISPASLRVVLEMMVDPDLGFEVGEFTRALAQM